MGVEGIVVTRKQREEVERQLRRTDLTRRVRERLEMVKAAALGDDVARIARWSGRSVATVERWLARFTDGGVTALADAARSGRPAQADAAYLEAMEAAPEMLPHELGLAFDVWTSERLSAYLEQQTARVSHRAGCARSWPRVAGSVGDPSTPSSTCRIRWRWPPPAPERYELPFQDETPLETNPSLCRT
jgi:transposase